MGPKDRSIMIEGASRGYERLCKAISRAEVAVPGIRSHNIITLSLPLFRYFIMSTR